MRRGRGQRNVVATATKPSESLTAHSFESKQEKKSNSKWNGREKSSIFRPLLQLQQFDPFAKSLTTSEALGLCGARQALENYFRPIPYGYTDF
ncbi:hypothetical protein QTP88_006527 [Uroleucon formosanum]